MLSQYTDDALCVAMRHLDTSLQWRAERMFARIYETYSTRQLIEMERYA